MDASMLAPSEGAIVEDMSVGVAVSFRLEAFMSSPSVASSVGLEVGEEGLLREAGGGGGLLLLLLLLPLELPPVFPPKELPPVVPPVAKGGVVTGMEVVASTVGEGVTVAFVGACVGAIVTLGLPGAGPRVVSKSPIDRVGWPVMGTEGAMDGPTLGMAEGMSEGELEGTMVGPLEGIIVGTTVGFLVGMPVGALVGMPVGVLVGAMVGAELTGASVACSSRSSMLLAGSVATNWKALK